MRCAVCGANNAEHFEFCTQCATPFRNKCTRCHSPNTQHSKFCGHCGHPLIASTPELKNSEFQITQPTQQDFIQGNFSERRQLTVLFCDLVGSTSLSERLDPEEYHRVVCAYHQVCTEEVRFQEGHIAQYLGDGVLIYFGHPLAHEDDAHRAIRTALSILNKIDTLSKRLQQESCLELLVRMGIHTGEVVVGEIGHDATTSQLALGETPNLAARAQSMADPGTIVITAATYRLVEPFFNCQDLGTHSLKNFTRPVKLFHVKGQTEIKTRMQALAKTGMTPLVGRDSELGFLMDWWKRSITGNSQTVMLRGEPGIGKSRLVESLKSHLTGESYSLLECYGSSYQQHTAFAPIAYLLQRNIGIGRKNSSKEKLSKLTTAMLELGFSPKETVPLLAPLLSIPLTSEFPPLDLTPLRQRQLTMEILETWLLGNTKHKPVLLIVEDLHWVDPSTIEFLGYILAHKPTYRIMILLTYRTNFLTPWPRREGQHELVLSRLSQEQTATLATNVAHNHALPFEVIQEVVKQTEGVPLFVEEVTKMILESGFLKKVDLSYSLTETLPSSAIPATFARLPESPFRSTWLG